MADKHDKAHVWRRCSDGSYVLDRPYRWVTHEQGCWMVRKQPPPPYAVGATWVYIGSYRTLREAKAAAESGEVKRD